MKINVEVFDCGALESTMKNQPWFRVFLELMKKSELKYLSSFIKNQPRYCE